MPQDTSFTDMERAALRNPSRLEVSRFADEERRAFDHVNSPGGDGNERLKKIHSLLRWRAFLRADAIERGSDYEGFDPALAADLLSLGEEGLDELPPGVRSGAQVLRKAMDEFAKSPADRDLALRLEWVAQRFAWDLVPLRTTANTVRARVGRRVSDTLCSISFHHPELGVTEAFLEIAKLPEGTELEGATFDMTVRLNDSGDLVMSRAAHPNAEPPKEGSERAAWGLPEPPTDWNDAKQVAEYRAAMRKLTGS